MLSFFLLICLIATWPLGHLFNNGVAQDFMGNCEVGHVSDGEFVTTKTAKTLDDKKKGEGEVGFSGIQKLMLLEFGRPPPTNTLSQCSQVLRPRCLCHLKKNPDCSFSISCFECQKYPCSFLPGFLESNS
ncbi:hypothetical protein ACFX2I_036962 [Malus domestica]